MIKYAVLGFGSRGKTYTENVKDVVDFVAVCDKNKNRIADACKNFGVKEENCFLSDAEFFSKGKMADLLVIATQDRDHFGHAMTALDLGYDLLLEKPIADSYEKCLQIYEKAREKKRQVFVCHVLRYAPFFVYIKDIIESGKIGKVETVNLTENVAYWHQAHSFVRGKWANTQKATPMIVQKCCHDLDILCWLTNSACQSVSSFGGLDYYKKDNAPEGSAEFCCECDYKENCPYDCEKIYKERPTWLFNCLPFDVDYSDWNAVKTALKDKSHNYGKCVFKCDNSAVDHQVVNLLFENGATAHLTMTAFSDDGYREIHVHGSNGEIFGSMQDNILTINVYGKGSEQIDIGKLSDGRYGHGGGDSRLALDVVEWFEHKQQAFGRTTIEKSLISHKIGFAAEPSRLNNGKTIDLSK